MKMFDLALAIIAKQGDCPKCPSERTLVKVNLSLSIPLNI